MCKVSVVIPTSKQKYLNETLLSLSQQTIKDFEVIVCENPSIEESTIELVNYYLMDLDIRIVQSTIGANNARNTGVSFSKFDIIALLDDDCKPEENWIEQVIKVMNDDTVSCVGGRVNLDYNTEITNLQSQYLTGINWGYTLGYRPLQKNEYIASCNLAFRKSVYYSVGGFNANLGYIGKDNFIPNDEVLFIRDCSNYGKVCYNDNMRILHLIKDRVNLPFFIKRAYGQGYANILLEKEQGIIGNCHNELIYYSEYNKEDIILQVAKHFGMLHAVRGIKPSNQFYSQLEDIINTSYI